MGRRAKAAVAGGEADPPTAERVHQRLRDLEFIDRLERIRMERATVVEGKFNHAGTDRDYARAFRDYGVDVDELPVETSIDRLKARPVLAVVPAAALDDWVFSRRPLSEADVGRWHRLVAVARGIDSEPLRDRVRAAWGQPVADVRDDLRRLADSIDVQAQHPATLHILAGTLQRVQHPDSAIRILRVAQYVHPGRTRRTPRPHPGPGSPAAESRRRLRSWCREVRTAPICIMPMRLFPLPPKGTRSRSGTCNLE